ncbi:MAG: hypothetical protein HW390_3526, partial [Candidatus Brocadiaceae bacterium]|nr:hypothetical protein [Candidatus Brocadiaceae bacterium]
MSKTSPEGATLRSKQPFILYYALSGLDGVISLPKALPWAMLFRPFRANRNKGLVVIIGFLT